METDRLVLRRLTAADVDDLVEVDSDPEVMRFITGGKPTPRVAIETRLLPRLLGEYDRFPGLGRWAAVEKTTGFFLGWVALNPSGSAGPELGYRLRRAAWGHGFATEASRALIRYAFTQLDVQRVWAQTMAVNVRSRRVMERAGLTLVRVFHETWDDPIEGTEHGEVEYALLKRDWSV